MTCRHCVGIGSCNHGWRARNPFPKAKQRKRPVEVLDVAYIRHAVCNLKYVRKQLRDGGAGNAANYVARALKSAEGALRHAQAMLARQERRKV
jgi:hypothetical protein